MLPTTRVRQTGRQSRAHAVLSGEYMLFVNKPNIGRQRLNPSAAFNQAGAPSHSILLRVIVLIALILAVGIFGFALFPNSLGEHKPIQTGTKIFPSCAESDPLHLSYYGATRLWPGSHGELMDYNLHSLDGGMNWYAFHTSEHGAVELIGNAEVVYPGLVKLLQNPTPQGRAKHFELH